MMQKYQVKATRSKMGLISLELIGVIAVITLIAVSGAFLTSFMTEEMNLNRIYAFVRMLDKKINEAYVTKSLFPTGNELQNTAYEYAADNFKGAKGELSTIYGKVLVGTNNGKGFVIKLTNVPERKCQDFVANLKSKYPIKLDNSESLLYDENPSQSSCAKISSKTINLSIMVKKD